MAKPDTLSPREIDAAVAAAIGWRDVHQKTGMLVGHAPGEHEFLRSVPAYSTDPAAALTVLAAWPGDVELRRQNGQWRCELFQPSQQWDAWGETLPLAICRCAIAAAAEFPTKGATP